jgi:predicted NodU family carbamoyl transferase
VAETEAVDGQLIAKETGFDGDILYSEHHQSHAASAFFPSPYERVAILTMDGVGEWATASWGVGNGNKIDLPFPHSLGLLYTAFTYYTSEAFHARVRTARSSPQPARASGARCAARG